MGQVKERTETLQPRRTTCCPVTGTRVHPPGMPRSYPPNRSLFSLSSTTPVSTRCTGRAAPRSVVGALDRRISPVRTHRRRHRLRVRNGPPAPAPPERLRRRPRPSAARRLLPRGRQGVRTGALCRVSAAARRGGSSSWDGRLPEVLVAGATRRARPASGSTARRAPATQDITRRQGIPVTSPLRTLLDLAGDPRRTAAAPRGRARRRRSAGRRSRELVRACSAPGPRRARAKLARIVADRPGADARGARGRRARPPAPRRARATRDVNVPLAIGGRRVDARLPLAGAAARRRGRRRRLARPPPRARGRRGAPGAARGRTASGCCASRWGQAVAARRRPWPDPRRRRAVRLALTVA